MLTFKELQESRHIQVEQRRNKYIRTHIHMYMTADKYVHPKHFINGRYIYIYIYIIFFETKHTRISLFQMKYSRSLHLL